LPLRKHGSAGQRRLSEPLTTDGLGMGEHGELLFLYPLLFISPGMIAKIKAGRIRDTEIHV
jgi:hypothetical protein